MECGRNLLVLIGGIGKIESGIQAVTRGGWRRWRVACLHRRVSDITFVLPQGEWILSMIGCCVAKSAFGVIALEPRQWGRKSGWFRIRIELERIMLLCHREPEERTNRSTTPLAAYVYLSHLRFHLHVLQNVSQPWCTVSISRVLTVIYIISSDTGTLSHAHRGGASANASLRYLWF